jgi:two-component sensor histidine kinase
VEDNGPGFALSQAAGRSASGLGLVTGLARQIGGKLQVERNGGAHCIIRFPARRHAAS